MTNGYTVNVLMSCWLCQKGNPNQTKIVSN